MNRRKLIGELLAILERKETRLLGWGFLDVSFSVDEIVETFREADPALVEVLDEWLLGTPNDLFIDNLAESNLLARVGDRYRTRFAETVRLLGRLRQRFSTDDWASAPNLVSDLKIHLAARAYPKRNISAALAWEQVKDSCWNLPIQRFVFETLTKVGDKSLALAAFQVRATQRILSYYRPTSDSTGTVVSAGTGSGKTKAFYLPAFMGIASDIALDGRDYMKVLAVYPRNVLLADQFTEAVSQAKLLIKAGSAVGRPITFGAYLGDTPYSANLRQGQYALKHWKQNRLGWIPPFIKHPDNGSELLWLDRDRQAGKTTLVSAEAPDQVVIPDGMIRLTRELIRQRPPDILMMSLEMLNKEMGSPINAAMLGFKTGLPAPRLVLLDEIHTHEGISGAQVPWILRRWSYWVRRWRRAEANPHFVGLSATLKDAASHLSTLTGVVESGVVEIKPEDRFAEIESEGIEYNLAIKSHAGTGASVLATSIQTVMLGARALTPSTIGKCNRDDGSEDLSPQCFFGRKVFGFTDNLDSLNRWMADFVDADRNRRLAKFRSTAGIADVPVRTAAGQVWKLSEDLGYDLNQALITSRCSSQDPGVDPRSDVVLATSSLEVGYDDPSVGMVVHHKAPRSAASFLQRKGRAGRERGTRPWTLVVLSDFGRDRWAFRDSERIFQPELDALRIPALNPYVVRVQATQFLIDWIGQRVGDGEPYRYLAAPDPTFQEPAKKLLNELITDSNRRAEFVRDVTFWLRSGVNGLRLTDPEALANSVLWNPPRAVLRHAIPELGKVLAGSFTPIGASTPIKQKRPLPRFIPAATFGELDAQDVEIVHGKGIESDVVDIAVALREAPPCRVSRRYAVAVRQDSLWHEYSETILKTAPSSIPVTTLFPDSLAIGSVKGVEIFQPQALRLVGVPIGVKDSSAGAWEWQIQADFVGREEKLGLIDGPVLSRVFSSCNGYFHRRYAHAVITRYASQFNYEVNLDRGIKKRGIVDLAVLEANEKRIMQGVGYRRLVDAVTFKIDSRHIESIPVVSEFALQRLRPLYFKYRLNNSRLLREAASSFGIGSLWNSSVAMLVATALLKKRSIKDAPDLLADRSGAAKKVFECMLLGEMASDLVDSTSSTAPNNSNRRIKEVQELWDRADIRDEVCRLESTLWEPSVPGFNSWLTEIYLETLARALEQTIWTLSPEIPEGGIEVDVTASDQGYALVVSEVASGGVGHLERLVGDVGNASERFDAAFEAAIKSCENDRLIRFIRSSVKNAKDKTGDVSLAFEQVRTAVSFNDLDSAKSALIDSFKVEGLAVDRSAVVALVSKVLRPGSSRQTDSWVRVLSRRRELLSERIGISLDPRVFAYWCMQMPTMSKKMKAYLRNIGQQEPTPEQVFNGFSQLTFQECNDSCPECLGVQNEMEGIVPSRALARAWIKLDLIDFVIQVEQGDGWKTMLAKALREARRIKLQFDDSRRVEIAKQLSALLAEEHDRGYIFSPFTILSARGVGVNWEMTLHPSGEIAL